jgi:hypothetical protein
MDLARYVEAQFGGMTPGQQSARLCLVTPADLKNAQANAKRVGLAHPPKDPMMCAMAVKAEELAKALGCERAFAWALISREREGLMKYIHQPQPAAPPKKGDGASILAYIVPEGSDGPNVEIVDDFDPDLIEVSPVKSHDAT